MYSKVYGAHMQCECIWCTFAHMSIYESCSQTVQSDKKNLSLNSNRTGQNSWTGLRWVSELADQAFAKAFGSSRGLGRIDLKYWAKKSLDPV
jgi:hypothetical protein